MTAELSRTPVVLLVFNRPEATARVFEVVKQVRPKKLLVVADGPRPGRKGEAGLCRRTREIATAVDWPCEVEVHFSEENLGCKGNVSAGLDWVFSRVEEAIVLEDDCLPDPAFFRFCEELLDRYRDETKISQICGSNYQEGVSRTIDSYYFSRHAHIWGWATWRRAWRQNDLHMTAWPELRAKGWLRSYLEDSKAAFYWTKLFDDSYRGGDGSLNSWAIPWTFSCWAAGNLSVIPNVNLVSNIGHSAEGTHTTGQGAANRTEVGVLTFPLRHPDCVVMNAEADLYTEETFYYGQRPLERLFWSCRIPLSVATVRRLRRLVSH